LFLVDLGLGKNVKLRLKIWCFHSQWRYTYSPTFRLLTWLPFFRHSN
jgi:hypothetical protein